MMVIAISLLISNSSMNSIAYEYFIPKIQHPLREHSPNTQSSLQSCNDEIRFDPCDVRGGLVSAAFHGPVIKSGQVQATWLS